MGRIVFLPWSNVKSLPGMCLSLVVLILKEYHIPILIYYSMCSDVNMVVLQQSPTEAMQFGQTLPRLLQHIFQAEPWWGPVFVFKVYLADE